MQKINQKPELLRYSGLETIGTDSWAALEMSSETTQAKCCRCGSESDAIKLKINNKEELRCEECRDDSIRLGTSFTVRPGEVWSCKSITGTQLKSKASLQDMLLECGSGVIEVISREPEDESEQLIDTFLIKLNESGNFSHDTSKSKFHGKAIGPFEEEREVFISFKPIEDKLNLRIALSAQFERILPAPTWRPNTISAAGTPATPQTDERYVREIYYIPYDEDELEDLPEPGYHELPDGKWHPCVKCLKILAGEEVSGGGLEILTGGDKKEALKKGEGVIDDSEAAVEEEKVLPNFEGGEKADADTLDEMSLKAKKDRASEVLCRVCKATGREDEPPVCKASCPKMVINDMIFSSWHKGPDGKYHYCQTCVDRLFEANGL